MLLGWAQALKVDPSYGKMLAILLMARCSLAGAAAGFSLAMDKRLWRMLSILAICVLGNVFMR